MAVLISCLTMPVAWFAAPLRSATTASMISNHPPLQLNYFDNLYMTLRLLPSMMTRREGRVVNISAIGVPLVRTPMIAPTVLGKNMPTLSHKELVDLMTQVGILKPAPCNRWCKKFIFRKNRKVFHVGLSSLITIKLIAKVDLRICTKGINQPQSTGSVLEPAVDLVKDFSLLAACQCL